MGNLLDDGFILLLQAPRSPILQLVTFDEGIKEGYSRTILSKQ